MPPQEGDHTLADPSSFAMDLTELTVETAEGSADVSLLVDGVSIASTTADATGTTVALDDSVSAGSTVELNVSNATSLGEITTSLLWS